ncbi:MAG: cation:proton antiporter [Pegethrix bostrychoides GSE-TBD4-15B]|jgi:Kef-type K+ transport system membrane component KefB|uniref:Cation:proton antiporter n=1 Tax=Pegethrix bostrychoides GSE-TBD4-15B TaxID=2839662 RepID=A0A951PCS3_9CYAN|nr:cation:proton antiporter [Pegethrix bostrychoides GSE-TBD4-15B]
MHLEPLASFVILLAVILILPICFERLRLPGLLGLLLAGVVLGEHGLQVLSSESETIRLLSGIGVIYLLFVSGLEIDLAQFQATRSRSAGFGMLTFAIPMVMGIGVGRLFGFDWNASVLIGSLFASHTLLAYPIISRLGVITNEAVTVTIGATIFTDVGALLVLAICVGINKGSFSALSLVSLLLSLMIYSALVLFGLHWLGKAVFQRSGDQEAVQFLFVLLAVFSAALGAELIGVEKIVGAFLAGLAVNGLVSEGTVKEKILFVGNVLFIPIFFVDIGLLIDLPAFARSIGSLGLTLAIVAGLILSKFLAAFCAQMLYRYSWREGITMWSLSLPQVAATLAATFVGYREGMLSEGVLNSVIVLMLVTATLGPLITSRAAAGLIPQLEVAKALESDLDIRPEADLTVVVPVYNPNTQRDLIHFGALLTGRGAGSLMPLAIAAAQAHLDIPELENAFQRSQELLARAVTLGREFGAKVQPLLRIDDDIAQGISRASREQQASLIVIGWSGKTGLQTKLFGSLIEQVLWSAHCPVAVTKLLSSPDQIRQILVPIEIPDREALLALQFAAKLAQANQASITLLHVVVPAVSDERADWIEAQFNGLVAQMKQPAQVKLVCSRDVVGAIVQQAQSSDLVILRASRRRTGSLGEVKLGELTAPILAQLHCSVVMLGEPQHHMP